MFFKLGSSFMFSNFSRCDELKFESVKEFLPKYQKYTQKVK